MRLLIATPAINGLLCGEYVASLLQSLGWCATERIYVEWKYLRGVSEISRGRDSLASYMLTSEFDKMLFIDADQGWTAEQFAAVVKSEAPIIGGTYCKKELPINLNFGCLGEHQHYFPDGLKTPEAFMRYKASEANAAGEVEIAFLPTGFMCVHRSVFEKMREHAPDYLSKDAAAGEEVRQYEFFPVGVINGRKDTEDWGFCRFARGCGLKIHLQTNAVIDHIGNFNYRLQRELL